MTTLYINGSEVAVMTSRPISETTNFSNFINETTVNSTEQKSWTDGEYDVDAAVCLAIFVIGFIGNVFVVLVIALRKNMHTATNVYLFSLALSDLFVLLSTTLMRGIKSYARTELYTIFIAPVSILCPSAIFSNYAATTSSVLVILAFSVERYLAVFHPFWIHVFGTVRKAAHVVVMSWILSMLYCSHWLYTAQGTRAGSCRYRASCPNCADVIDSWYIADFVVFLGSAILLIVLYTRISWKLTRTNDDLLADSKSVRQRKRDKLLETSSTVERKAAPQLTPHRGLSYMLNLSVHAEILRRMVVPKPPKVSIMLLTITISFIVLLAPYKAQQACRIFKIQRCMTGEMGFVFLQIPRWGVYLNSAVNPILYGIMSKRFRNAIFATVCFRSNKNPVIRIASQANQAPCGIRRNGVMKNYNSQAESQVLKHLYPRTTHGEISNSESVLELIEVNSNHKNKDNTRDCSNGSSQKGSRCSSECDAPLPASPRRARTFDSLLSRGATTSGGTATQRRSEFSRELSRFADDDF